MGRTGVVLTVRATVLGSTSVDVVLTVAALPGPGETALATSSRREPGGKGANQAAALARLGADVVLLSAVGDDADGRWSLAQLTERGVDVRGVRSVDRPTGLAVVMVDIAGENAIVVAPGANELVVPPASVTADVVVLSLEVPLDVVAAAARTAAASGALVVLNAAPTVGDLEEVLADTDVLVVNEVELDQLGGDATALVRQGPGAVVVTLGRRGCRVVTADGDEEHAAAAVEVVDTTGAGDCFTAALAFGLASAWPLGRTARFAVAAAGLSVAAPGARGGHPTAQEVLARLD